MREFKFRVWDKENNQFFQPTYAAHKGELEDISIALGGSLLIRNMKYKAVHQSLFPDRFEPLQQYTGLKDKNGVEIYEGDIVNSFMQENSEVWKNFEALGQVTYFESHAQFLIKCENTHPQIGFDLFEMGDTERYEVLEIEVVGNIYGENHVR